MKKAMAILLAAVLALACTACGGSKNGETKDRLAQIKEKGYIELCTEPYFAPYEYVDPNKSGEDQYQGMDIEVARYIADKLGVDLKITALDFTAVLAGVADGKYDFAISAIAYAPSRAEAMRLSDVYYSSNTGYGFIVRTEDIDKYNDLNSLKDAVVITQSGSVQEALYNQYINGACKEFKLVANMTDGYLAVAEGKADVCICSTASAQLYADANGGMSIPDYRFEVDPNMNGTCVAMPMDGTESLAELVNQCIAELKENGVRKTVMLTGDAEKAASRVAAELGIDEYHSELLPADKVEQVERLLGEKNEKEKLAFVGDGINDAPVLSRADVGIAMGALGSDAAIEAADIVLMDDDPAKISFAKRISVYTLKIVKENIVFSLIVKAVCLILGAVGIANMWVAIFADVGVMVIAVLNATRALKLKK